MKLKFLSACLIAAIGSMNTSYADSSYAYMKFDISQLSLELKKQMKVLKIQFSPHVNYAHEGYPVFHVSDPIKTGTEGGFRAEGGKWEAAMTVTVGTADWQ